MTGAAGGPATDPLAITPFCSPLPILAQTLDYFGPSLPLTELTSTGLRDFLSRWIIENAGPRTGDGNGTIPQITAADAAGIIEAFAVFFDWTEQNAPFPAVSACRALLVQLQDSVPKALQIAWLLSDHLRRGGGAFTFPEFLTSFEDGGRAEFDFDAPGEAGCLEGYFRILSVEGTAIEAEELITETRVWPVAFPANVAALLWPGLIINLELLRTSEGWQITACGLAYPPETDE